jgi:hypothetical protein
MLAVQIYGQEDISSRRRKDTYLVLFAEHSRSNDAANTTGADKSRRAESSLPLAPDIVGLPSEDTRHVGIARDGCEEDAEISDAIVLSESEKRETFSILRCCHNEGVASTYQ